MNTLQVVKRAATGRNACNVLRKTGQVPGTIYGGKQEPISISFPLASILPHLRSKDHNKQFQLKLDDGREEKVEMKEVQVNSLTDTLLHIDFYRIG